MCSSIGRAAACGAAGCGFKSHHAPKNHDGEVTKRKLATKGKDIGSLKTCLEYVALGFWSCS